MIAGRKRAQANGVDYLSLRSSLRRFAVRRWTAIGHALRDMLPGMPHARWRIFLFADMNDSFFLSAEPRVDAVRYLDEIRSAILCTASLVLFCFYSRSDGNAKSWQCGL
jgi:hypothetical protein